jgi:hypothetical protein
VAPLQIASSRLTLHFYHGSTKDAIKIPHLLTRQISFPGDPSQQKCVKCLLYPLPSSSCSIYYVTYTWVPRVRLSSTSSHHRFQVTFNLRPWRARGCDRRPWRARGCERRPWRAAVAHGPSTAVRGHGGHNLSTTASRRPWRAAAAAHGRKRLLREPRPPAAATLAAWAPTVVAAASAPTSPASSPGRRRDSARSARRWGIELPSESTTGGPHARRLDGGGPGERAMG